MQSFSEIHCAGNSYVHGANALSAGSLSDSLESRIDELEHLVQQADSESQHTAALLDLLTRMDGANDLRDGCYTLVNELRDYLQSHRVAVGLRRRGTGSCRLFAVSGIARFDKRSEMTKSIESALDEAILRDEIGVWPQPEEQDRHAMLALRKVASQDGIQSAICAPLRNLEDVTIGAWLFLERKAIDSDSPTTNLVRAFELPIAMRLDALRRPESNPVIRLLRLTARYWNSWKAKLVVAAVLLLFAAMAMPLPYKVKCDCTLEPVKRRFVAAPFEGTLEKSLVKPGDIVSEGDVLARMDGREVRWKRAGLIADQQQAGKKRDSALAAHNYAEAQIAKLEMERLQLEIRLLDDRAEHLLIKSPIDGIVASGDLERAEGAPLTIGQSLFEIAPLSEMIVEVAIPHEDIAYVNEDQRVSVRLDAYPNQSWNLQIEKIHPRSEIRDHENVFVAESTLANDQETLRPGMNGRAKIVTPKKSLGWILFHKPWNAAARWFGW